MDTQAQNDTGTTPALVRMDTLVRGDRFAAMNGSIGTFLRQHGSNHGAYIVLMDDGHETCFAGCATVTLL